jgi:hypothetical protein
MARRRRRRFAMRFTAAAVSPAWAGDQPTWRRLRRRGRSAASPAARFTQTADAGQLSAVYKRLGSKAGSKRVKRDASSSFAAAGRRPAPRRAGDRTAVAGRLP